MVDVDEKLAFSEPQRWPGALGSVQSHEQGYHRLKSAGSR
jgi:hypothetical protein